jgi:hypothetical protein
MDSSKLNDWLQVVGIFAVVASLIFVGLQMKQTDDIATVEILNESGTRTRELKTLIAENADVWGRGCIGEELTDAERIRFGQVYTAYTNAAYIGWKRVIVAGLSDFDPQFLINSVAANLHRFSGLRSLQATRAEWDANGRQYTDPYISLYSQKLAARLAELAEIEPEPIVDVTWCGRL